MKIKLGKGYYILSRGVISVILICMLFPIIWIFSIAFRQEGHIFEAYFYIIPKFVTLSNFVDAWNYVEEFLGISFPRMFLNSGIVTSLSILIALVISILGAFSFSHYKFRGKSIIFNSLLLTMMLPIQIMIIPLFIFFAKLKVLETFVPLILIYAAFGIPMSVLILTNFFRQIPIELWEASKIDGASEIIYLFKILVPLSKPAIATCIIFLFLGAWNEFLIALIFIKRGPLQTLPEAISRLAGGEYVITWGIYTASIFITTIPIIIIFLIFQKWFTQGLTMGAVKG